MPRIAAIVAAVVTLSVAAACSSDTVAGPELARSNNLLSDITNGTVKGVLKLVTPVVGLLRQEPLKAAIVKSAMIGSKGGEIEIKETGLTIEFPEGAITGAAIRITVTALPGQMVAYDFQPHGTKFAKPVVFEQKLDGTSWERLKLKGVLAGGYFKDVSQLDLVNNMAKLDETYPVVVEKGKVSFNIFHFSGYLVSTGRSSEEQEEMF